MCIYIYIHIYIYMCVYIYIIIYRLLIISSSSRGIPTNQPGFNGMRDFVSTAHVVVHHPSPVAPISLHGEPGSIRALHLEPLRFRRILADQGEKATILRDTGEENPWENPMWVEISRDLTSNMSDS